MILVVLVAEQSAASWRPRCRWTIYVLPSRLDVPENGAVPRL